MTENETLARRALLWLHEGNPEPMQVVLAPSFPNREALIERLAAFARRPEILPQLPDESLLPFFSEEPGSDMLEQAVNLKVAARITMQVARGAELLGMARGLT
jgi:hypothetical protein